LASDRRRRAGSVALARLSAVLLAAVTWAELAAADAPSDRSFVRLSYARESGAEQCPDESVVRESVSTRLGYDPFDDRAARVLKAVVRRSGRSFVARIELYDATGKRQGARDLAGSGMDCGELATAMAIAMSLGIDPLSATAPPPPKPPAPAMPVVPEPGPPPQVVLSTAPPPPAARPEPAAKGAPLRARFGAGASVAWGISPATPAAGATLIAGLRRGIASLELEGAADFSPTATKGSVRANSSLWLASLAPCLHFGIGLGCVIGGLGSLDATGLVKNSESGQKFFADVGLRLGVEIPFADRFYVALHVDALATPTHITYDSGAHQFWTTPPGSIALGITLGVVP